VSGELAVDSQWYVDQNGFIVAVQNVYFASTLIAMGIVSQWDNGMQFGRGIRLSNYIRTSSGHLGRIQILD
jgi:hypothetical protein